jgi:hypothetical protein
VGDDGEDDDCVLKPKKRSAILLKKGQTMDFSRKFQKVKAKSKEFIRNFGKLSAILGNIRSSSQ